MNFFQKTIDRFRVGFSRTLVKAMAFPIVPAWAIHSFLQPTYRALVREGYQKNAAVFACVSAHAFAFPEPPLRVWRETEDGGREIIARHKLTALLNKPNAFMGQAKLWQYTILFAALGGNCYWYKVRSARKQVVELWALNDSQIRPIPGEDVLISHYEVLEDGSRVGEPQTIPVEDIVHFMWLPDPEAPWRGMSPLKPLASEIDTDNELDSYLFSLLKNLAIPPIALKVPGALDDAVFKRLREQWKERYGGENRGLPAVLEGGVEVEKLGLDLQQLAFEALRNIPESRIAAALKVPAIVAGLHVGLENATYDNVKGLHTYYTERTLVPLWRNFSDEVQARLLPDFDKSEVVCAFDLSQVSALVEALNAKREWALKSLQASGITVNEFRAEIGKPRDVGGDVYLRSMAVMEVPFGEKRELGDGGQGSGNPDNGSANEDALKGVKDYYAEWFRERNNVPA